MKSTTRFTSLAWAFLLCWHLSGNSTATEFFVAPDGSDSSAGTREHPFGTLNRARDAARALSPGQQRWIIVRGGEYFNVSLTLGPEDSGLTIVSAPGEKPVLYGGVPINGWEKDGDSFYAARLPGFPLRQTESRSVDGAGEWQVRLLQVNGRFSPRARFPKDGALEHSGSFGVPWMSSTGGGWKRPPTIEELTTLKYKPGQLSPELEVRNAEVTVFHMWDESCVGVSANDPERGFLKLAPPCGHPPGAFGVKKYAVWNTREGMAFPGQWYHDRVQNRLVYWPLADEDMNRAEVIAPTVATILRIQGRSEKKAREITVRGLAFSVTTVPLVAGGFAAARFDGAISLEHVEDCSLIDLAIARVAGQGINTKNGCAGVRVENCEVTECGAGGIYVGGRNALIRNNHVHRVGISYPSAIGIYRGGRNNVVAHNEVHDCPYSAINYGGENNRIESNLLYDCMKVLHDGGAIYIFAGRGCVLRGNVARDFVDTGGYGASAYYLDERSTGCVVENNLALRVSWPSHNHMATNNIIRNNVFIVRGDAKLTFPRSSEFTFEKNVLWAAGKIRFEGVNAVDNWSKNLFFSGSGRIEQVRLDNYARVDTAEGAPGDTVAADPMFTDWERGEYSFLPGSPAHRLGIAPIDVSAAGRMKTSQVESESEP